MKIKHPLSTLLAFIIVGCSEPDPMKERYIQDCSADGAATETCSCLFDYGKKNMSEIEFMSSDFTHAYRRDNNIPKPGFEFNGSGQFVDGSGQPVDTEKVFILVDPDCEGICDVKRHPDYPAPPSQENIANIAMDAFAACN
tara:strand:+ start:425 stop:847 length:423 start_codon:yes stop_codon:yes gene_type:complete